MALTHDQAILSVTTKGADLRKAIDALEARLDAYPEARIISLNHNVDQWAGFFSAKTSLVAVVEFTPPSSNEAAAG